MASGDGAAVGDVMGAQFVGLALRCLGRGSIPGTRAQPRLF